MARRFLQAAIAVASISTLISTVTAQASTTAPAAAIQTLDCYSNKGDLTDQGPWTYQSSGYCQPICAGLGMPVMATTGGSNCLCGSDLPPASDKVSSDHCDTPCQGFDTQMCGGIGYYQVYLSGIGAPDGVSSGSSSSSSSASTPSSTTSAKPSVVTVNAGTTVIATPTAKPASTSQQSSGGGGSSKVGIAVGVVVGVIALAAIIGLAVFLFKRRRNQAIEEEHRRNAAVNGFVAGGKSETSSTIDPRLDPQQYGQRRNSIGSIADEADFTRRILHVSALRPFSLRQY